MPTGRHVPPRPYPDPIDERWAVDLIRYHNLCDNVQTPDSYAISNGALVVFDAVWSCKSHVSLYHPDPSLQRLFNDMSRTSIKRPRLERAHHFGQSTLLQPMSERTKHCARNHIPCCQPGPAFRDMSTLFSRNEDTVVEFRSQACYFSRMSA